MNFFRQNKILYYLHKLSDWFLIGLLFGSIKVFNILVPPFRRQFSVYDTSIAYPYAKKETINNWMLWLLSLVLPIVVIMLVWVKKRDHRETYYAMLGLFLSSLLAYFICHFVKNIVGRLRPDFLDRCNPNLSRISSDFTIAKLYDISICGASTEVELDILRAGSQSFFSGHASTAFAGLGFLSFYLSYVLRLPKRPGSVYKVWIVLLPHMIALFIGLSRISDYRHHWEDVLVGLIAGLLCAYFSYILYFPISEVKSNIEDLSPTGSILSRYSSFNAGA